MSTTRSPRRHVRARRRRIYRIRRAVVACACLLLVLGVTLSTRGSLRALNALHAQAGSGIWSSAMSPYRAPEQTPTEDEHTRKQREEIAALGAPLTDAQRNEIYAKAKQTAQSSGALPTRMTYCIASRGNVGSVDHFANTVYRALNDVRGWPRAGVVFAQGQSGQCDVTITLAEAKELPSFSAGCSEEYSCRVGNDVIINKTRWDGAVQHWFDAGATLAQYRTMVINHEVGHALGHIDNETPCGGNKQAAPLMQEQSMFLKECSPNPWPLDSELWSTFVGAEP
ncbi:DUF3152 domain-containing protein [Bifidobacterium pseudolongum]|uniref:DUF3152 domain-containing protein n=1 Tax=Bifidobacterium pseudolongum TaxID=1694 RepID=UPI001CE037B9|nr:DUF3152 domain-containing protein [Bifidobacterium pseudolongum]UBY94585.1 DUF3152 domain-containing protein [Bifidobacterium pseudolongum]UBZ03418.1 DUF3152 domain-containing protein [Bifidobacterium pseudolongum]UBZ04993.1 DUF3152 domain-containing protein [Bifidobacterium pseudolongum]UDL24003.1 DUF3152 domain-containing protein [Bifidobacterium pseudolongum]